MLYHFLEDEKNAEVKKGTSINQKWASVYCYMEIRVLEILDYKSQAHHKVAGDTLFEKERYQKRSLYVT